MCVKLSPKKLNLGPCPPYSTSTYTYEVTIALRMPSGKICDILNYCKYDLIK